jgi:exonuclease VII small subunit
LTQVNTRATDLESSVDSLESEISTEVDSLDTRATDLESSVDSLESEISTEVDSLDTRASDLESSVNSLEEVLVEDNEFYVEIFNNITSASGDISFTVSDEVQDDNPALVWAFINGVQVRVVSATGSTVVLDVDYALETSDEIIIQYQGLTVNS